MSSNNNLQLFRFYIQHFLRQSQQPQSSQITKMSSQQVIKIDKISTYDKFKSLVNYLCDQKLLHPTQVKKLINRIQPNNMNNIMTNNNNNNNNKNQGNSQQNNKDDLSNKIKKKKVNFPLSIKQLENIIKTQFGDQNCQNLMNDLKRFKTLLKQIKGILNVWKDKGLTNQQKAQLQTIFSKGNQQILILCEQLKNKKNILQKISQQQIQMIKSLDQWVKMQNVKMKYQNYQQFQKDNQQIIQTLYHRNLVKDVHFKKKDVNLVMNKGVSDIIKVIGFNAKNDSPVEVTLISKTSINFSKINKQLLKFDALKQLTLSQHFINFHGFNTHSNPHSLQYFTQYIQSKNLFTLILSTHQLDITNPLIKYWIYQIYKCFYDLYYMCSYEVELPIRLKDFQIKQYGLNVVMKNVRFSQKRKKIGNINNINNINKINKDKNKQNNKKIDSLQTKMLQNLAKVTLELLKIQPKYQQIDTKVQKLQDKCFFKSLLNCIDSHKNYQQGIVQNYLSFFNLQTHPLIEQAQFYSNGSQIVSTYIATFGEQ